MDINRKDKKQSKIHQILKSQPEEIKKVIDTPKVVQEKIEVQPHVISTQKPQNLNGGVKQVAQPTTKNPYVKPPAPNINELIEVKKKAVQGQIQQPYPPKDLTSSKYIQVNSKHYNKVTPFHYYSPQDQRHENAFINIIIICNGDEKAFDRMVRSIKLQSYKYYKVWVLPNGIDTDKFNYINDNTIPLTLYTPDYYELLSNDYEIGLFKTNNNYDMFLDDIMLRITNGWVLILQEDERLCGANALNSIASVIQEDIDIILLKNELLQDCVLTEAESKVLAHNFICKHTLYFYE